MQMYLNKCKYTLNKNISIITRKPVKIMRTLTLAALNCKLTTGGKSNCELSTGPAFILMTRDLFSKIYISFLLNYFPIAIYKNTYTILTEVKLKLKHTLSHVSQRNMTKRLP